jgi:bacterioferritin
MKGSERSIDKHNDLLAHALTAIDRYVAHSEMCANWGYERLHKADEKRAIDEMEHTEKLIARILFLEGRPIVSKQKDIHIGADVEAQHQNDWQSEFDAGRSQNDGIRLAVEVADKGKREILEDMVKESGRTCRLARSSK